VAFGVGFADGFGVGFLVGFGVGFADGFEVGFLVGFGVGFLVGFGVGFADGFELAFGVALGLLELFGFGDAFFVGASLGSAAVGVFASDRPQGDFNPGALDPQARALYNRFAALWKQRTGAAAPDEENLAVAPDGDADAKIGPVGIAAGIGSHFRRQ